ncbi:unnamed protein product [Urochloa humidicola]
MEQQPQPTGVQRADCHVVVRIELQVHQVNGDADESHGNVNDDVQPRLARDSAAADHGGVLGGVANARSTSHESVNDHVIDVAPPEDDADNNTNNCCIVCTEPSEWVAIGRCGHRVVCRKCMVRTRFFHRDKRCCVCRARCPKVIVAKRGARVDILSTLPLFVLREGRVGKRPLWYHSLTAAYYEDEREYNAARAACEGILSPFFHPLCWFLVLYGCLIGWGVIIGTDCTVAFKHRSARVTAYVVSISVAMLIATIIWSAIKCNQDPLERERYRHEEEQ